VVEQYLRLLESPHQRLFQAVLCQSWPLVLEQLHGLKGAPSATEMADFRLAYSHAVESRAPAEIRQAFHRFLVPISGGAHPS
jgi:hypothetical protein